MSIDGFHFSVALALGIDELLLGERRQELIGVLAVAQGDDIGGVDLFKNRNLSVEVGVRIERLVLEVLDGGLKLSGALLLSVPMVSMPSSLAPSVSSMVA